MKLLPSDPSYPSRLLHLPEPPPITVSGPLVDTRSPPPRVVAIVGSRSALRPAQRWVHQLAYHLARAGLVVVSGGAKGIDRAAHEGAVKGGTTWCVACFGRGAPYPDENAQLFEQLETSGSSRMIWPFSDLTPVDEKTPRIRNGVLIALADLVIVVQASFRSGSRNAIGWARHLDRRLLVVPGPPWDHGFGASIEECLGGAEVLWSVPQLFALLGLARPELDDPDALPADSDTRPLHVEPRGARRKVPLPFVKHPLSAPDKSTWTSEETLVFSILSPAPMQQDTIIEQSGLPTSSTLTALLTLSLKDVVVEGPDGFFRRRNAL